MANKKKKRAAEKKISIQLSWAETAGWGGVLLLIFGWFFVLGIAVGRGLIPAADTEKALQKELLKARQEALAQRDRQEEVSPPVEYHEALTEEGDEAVAMAAGDTPPADATPRTPPVKTAEKYKPLDNQQDPNNEPVAEPSVATAAAAPPAVPSATPEGEKIFTIQIAALRSQETADALAAELGGIGHPAHIVEVSLSAGNVWYRVRAGAYASRETAATDMASLKDAGYEPILVKRETSQ